MAQREAVHLRHGKVGEDLAYRQLRKLGYTVVARNYRPRVGRGEIDLIAWDGPQLVFVEVKARTREDFGSPESAVDSEKRRQIVRAAGDYLRRSGHPWACVRFDTVSVLLRDPPEVAVQKDVFTLHSEAAGWR
jgi:putative endonuclease